MEVGRHGNSAALSRVEGHIQQEPAVLNQPSTPSQQVTNAAADAAPDTARTPSNRLTNAAAAAAAAAPDTASTEVWGDLEVSLSPIDDTPARRAADWRQAELRDGIATPGLLHDQLHSSEQGSHSQLRTQALQRRLWNVDASHAAHAESLQRASTAANADGIDRLTASATPAQKGSSLHWQSRVDASPIDLVTPSSGVASTVATPTFSETGEVCDLTSA